MVSIHESIKIAYMYLTITFRMLAYYSSDCVRMRICFCYIIIYEYRHNFVSVLGVLMWEVFTCGKMPYGRLKNTEVVERVQRGIVLERPKQCYKEVYEVSE